MAATRRNSLAIDKAVKEAGDRLSDTELPLILLCKTLAGQMDDAEEAGIPAPPYAVGQYLSALKDLRRILAAVRKPAVSKTEKVDELRARRTAPGR